MSNKIQLQTNNADLQSLIDRVNAAKDIAASLPEAGGGGDEDGPGGPSGPGLPSNPGDLPASVTFLVRILEPGGDDLIYVNASGVKTTTTWTGLQPMTIDDCRPNSFIILFGSNSSVNSSGGIEKIAYGVPRSGEGTPFTVFFIGTTTGSIN